MNMLPRTFGLLMFLALPFALSAATPSLFSKQALANGYCAFTRPSLGPDGNFFLAVYACGVTSPLVAGIASFDSGGALRWGQTYPSDCDQNARGNRGIGRAGVSVALDGTIFAVGDWNQCRNGRLVAYEPLLGAVLWSSGGCISSPHPRQVPLINDADNSVTYGSSHLCSVDIATGELNWVSGSVGQYIGGYGIVGDHGHNIAYGTIGRTYSELTSVDASGLVRWRDSYVYSDASHQTVVAVTSSDDFLVQRLSPTSVLQLRSGVTGAIVWETSNLQYPVIGENEIVFAGTEVGNEVVALDSNGNQVWRASVGTGSSTFVDFVTAENNLFVRSGSELSFVDGSAGLVLWTFAADANLSVPVALNADGQPFFVDDIGQAYVLDTCSEYQTTSPWPVARHGNERHTGVASATTSVVAKCQQNEPPVANAGSDVSVRAGDLIQLDGTLSFDDNDALSVLSPNWMIVSAPTGSMATLAGNGTFVPTLTTDLAGAYEIELVVTDSDGADSTPDLLLVSTEDLAPTAEINAESIVVVGAQVTLDGSESTDPESSSLSFDWGLSVPTGSLAALSSAVSTAPSFAADIAGNYVASLVVSDLIGPSTAASVTITAISAEDYASGLIDNSASIVASLADGDITTQGNVNAFINFLQQAAAALQIGNYAEAISKLEKALHRIDGCALRGSPDGNGPDRDWVTSCGSQQAIYDALSEALTLVQP